MNVINVLNIATPNKLPNEAHYVMSSFQNKNKV